MRNTRADVIEAGLRVLDSHGLEFCSMRRVAAELEVQPSALYHHVPNKQTLLAFMADEIVGGVSARYRASRSTRSSTAGGESREGGEVREGVVSVESDAVAGQGEDPAAFCKLLRRALLSVRDGADVVATAVAFRLGGSSVEAELAAMVGTDGARTLLLYTFGQAQATQTQLQAQAIGALPELAGQDAEVEVALEADLDRSFDRGIAIILAGLG